MNERIEESLELLLEPLEQRLLLAADWTTNGNALTITGDETNDFVVVSQASGNVKVQLSSGGLFEDTGIANLERLVINLGDGNDTLKINVNSSKSLKVDMGLGDDKVSLDGQHKKAVVNGNSGDDFIVMAGITVDRGKIVGGDGGDTVGFDFSSYSLGQLNGLSSDKVSFKLGAGEDIFQLMAGETVVGEDNISLIGIPGVDTVSELIDFLTNAGFGDALKGFSLNGGADIDLMLGPGANELVVGLGAKVSKFEADV